MSKAVWVSGLHNCKMLLLFAAPCKQPKTEMDLIAITHCHVMILQKMAHNIKQQQKDTLKMFKRGWYLWNHDFYNFFYYL